MSSNKQLLALTRGVRAWITLSVLLGLLLFLLSVAQITLIGRIIDWIRLDVALPWWSWLAFFGVFGVIFAFRSIFTWISRIVTHKITSRTKLRLRDSIYTHIQRLGPGFLNTERTGALVNTAAEGIENMEVYFGQYIPQLVLTYIIPILALSYIAWLDWMTALALLAGQLLIPPSLAILRYWFGSVGEKFLEAANTLSAMFLDSLQGMTTLKMFNRSKAYTETVQLQAEKLHFITMDRLFINLFGLFFIEWISVLGTIVVASGFAFWRLQNEVLSLGSALMIVLLSVEISRPLLALRSTFQTGVGGAAAAQSIFALLATKPSVVEKEDVTAPARYTPNITFDNVRFSYALAEVVRAQRTNGKRRWFGRKRKTTGLQKRVAKPKPAKPAKQAGKRRWFGRKKRGIEFDAPAPESAETVPTTTEASVSTPLEADDAQPATVASQTETGNGHAEPSTTDDRNYYALNKVSFEIQPGETVAIVGPSGAGKSTIVNLLFRFYDPQEGMISLGGYQVQYVPIDWLRSQMTLVAQDTYLFYGSVAENLRLAKPEATQEELEKVTRAAQIHDFIAALPDGYDTQIGERGLSLSGGQVQRIAIARALLKDAPIIILDEATSQIDAETEAALHRELATFTQNKIVLMVAHRMSTIRNADRIIVLDDGKLVESGTHAELRAQSGLYTQLVTAQYTSAMALEDTQ